MADKKVQGTEVSGAADQGEAIIQKAKGFWAKFSKPITYIGSAIILLTGGWFAYKYLYKQPKEVKGQEAIFLAEQLFASMTKNGFNKDSINLVLNGGKLADGTTIKGVLNTISKHSGTTAANTAHYLAGACYLHNKEFDKAIKQLKEYDGNGATQLQSMAYGMLGDAYAELKKNDDAMSYYKKAASANDKDNFVTPDALMKAAMFCEMNNKPKDAIEMYQKIKDNFPKSVQAQSVDKYLARLGITDNK